MPRKPIYKRQPNVHLLSSCCQMGLTNILVQSTSAGLGTSKSRMHSRSSKRKAEDPPGGLPPVAESGGRTSKPSRYVPLSLHHPCLACLSWHRSSVSSSPSRGREGRGGHEAASAVMAKLTAASWRAPFMPSLSILSFLSNAWTSLWKFSCNGVLSMLTETIQP